MTNAKNKSLDAKLARLAADSACRDFILADAKDADMAFGLSAPWTNARKRLQCPTLSQPVRIPRRHPRNRPPAVS